jgi:arginine N-succinyltransferase
MERFRAVLVSREQVRDDHVVLSSGQAEALLLEDQAELRLIPLRYE